MGIIDKLFGDDKKNDEFMTDDEKELRDYEANVYMAESGVDDNTSAEFVISDVFFLIDTVVTGTVTSGVFNCGDKVRLYHGGEPIFTTEIQDIEQFKQNGIIRISEGAKGAFRLKGISKQDSKRIKENDLIKKI